MKKPRLLTILMRLYSFEWIHLFMGYVRYILFRFKNYLIRSDKTRRLETSTSTATLPALESATLQTGQKYQSSIGKVTIVKTYFVYILRSTKNGKFFIGLTEDLYECFERHNSGRNPQTTNLFPFELIYYEPFINFFDAKNREKYFRSETGNRFLKKHLHHYFSSKKTNSVGKILKVASFISVQILLILLPTLLVLLKIPEGSQAAWYSSGWSKRKKLTVDNTKVSGSSDLTNFSILVSITDTDLKNYAQSDADDILFTSQDGTTKLNHEVEKYTSTTGALVAWVQIPTLYTATDTIIYMYYGNSGASSQQSIAATWDSNYAAVYHFAQTPSGGGAKELNSENNTIQGTPAGTWVAGDLQTGKIGDGLKFDRATSDRVTLTDNHSGNNITVSGWVNNTTVATGDWNTLAMRTDTGSFFDWQIYTNACDANGSACADNKPVVRIDFDNGSDVDVASEEADGGITLSTSTWYFLTATYDGSAVRFYRDGSLIESTTCTTCTITDSSNDIWVGGNSVWGEYFNGIIDEFRVSTTYRSTDWITTEYNNQNSPSTFFTTGSQENQSNSAAETPVLYWGMDEGNGSTVNDRSGNSNSGTITNAVWKTEDLCVSGKCLFFDGTGDYVSRASDTDFDFSYNDSFSITGWLRHKVSSSGTDMILARHNGAVDGGFKLYMDLNGNIVCGIDRDSSFTPEDSVTSTAGTYDDNQWHHVACVKSSNTSLTLYIDGNSVGTPDSSLQSSGTYASTDTLYLGIDGDGSSNGFEGFLDDFKIYRAALSSSQLKADMNNKGSVRGAAAHLGQQDNSFLTDGLVGYWKFDESSGLTKNCTATPFTDDSGNSINGKSCPSTTGPDGGATGRYGNSVSFDGTDDYIVVTAANMPSMNGNMTFSLWYYGSVYPTTDDSNLLSITDNSTGANNFELGTSGFLQTRTWAGISTLVSTTPPSLNTWHHLVYSFDGTYNKIYIDGVLSATNSSVSHNTGSTTEVHIGNRYASGATSKLDDIRIYNRTLSDSEIRQLYSWAPGPIGYWKLDENSGTSSVFDSSGNGNTGTLTAAVASDWVIGKYGSAFNFDTTRKSKISLGTSSLFEDMNTLTASVWLFPRTTGDNNEGRFFDKTSSTGPTNGWYFKFRNSAQQLNFAADYNTVDLSINSTDAIPLNTWSHVTATWDGNADPSGGHVHIYINGIETSSYTGAATGTGGRVSDSASQLKLGNYQGSSNYRTFDGYMDDAKLYNYIRTPQQIVEDMNGSHPIGGSPVGSQLVYTKLDEQNGNTINNSGSAKSTYNGTNSGAAWLTSINCKTNGCLNFDTTTDNVTFNDVSFVDSIASMSATMWLNPQTLQTTKSIVSKITTSAASNSFAVVTDSTNSDEIRVYIASSTSDTSNYFLTSNLDLVNSSWQHLEVIYDGTLPAANRVTVYKNGRAVSGSVTGTIPNTMTSGSTSELRLGDDQGSTYTTLLAYIDEFKLYNSALTQDQIRIDYNQGSAVNFGVGAPTPEPAQLSDGAGSAPVGYWTFNENKDNSCSGGTADACDISGNGFDLSNAGKVGWAAGKIGSAIKFGGASADKTTYNDTGVSSLDISSSFTIQGWVKFNNLNTDFQSILVKHATSDSTGNYSLASGATAVTGRDEIDCAFNDGGSNPSLDTTSANLVPNTWYFITCVFNTTANTFTIYVNGIQSVQDTGITTDPITGNSDLFIGNDSAGLWANPLDGYIDEVKIYNYARTQSQIMYDYNRGGPIGWWKFDECTGGTAYDSGSQTNNGTLGGTSGSNTSNGSCSVTDTATKWYNGIDGKFNASLDFDGTDDNVNLGDLSYSESVSQLSWSVWVKPATLAISKGIVAKANSNTTQTSWGVGTTSIDSNEPDCFISTNTTDLSTAGYTTTNVLSVGTWTHITCVFDGTQADNSTRLKMYIDGKLQSLTFAGTIPAITQATTSNVLVGASSDNALNFDGQIDDVRVYSYPLSTTQVQKIYSDGSSVFFGPATGSP